jgi:hypothetical protein
MTTESLSPNLSCDKLSPPKWHGPNDDARTYVEGWIAYLIDALDRFDGDVDLETTNDEETYLSNGAASWGTGGSGTDCELDPAEDDSGRLIYGGNNDSDPAEYYRRFVNTHGQQMVNDKAV